MKKIIIAIDGLSGCGKSTLARQLAEVLDYIYIDTGAMYRAITLYFLNNNIVDIQEEKVVKEALNQISLAFEKNEVTDENEITLNGQKVEKDIRDFKVADKVSEIAALAAVRKFAVKAQKKMAVGGGVVMDGRDIGTVVFPNAALKIFLTASTKVRVERRFKELIQKDASVTKAEVQRNLENRDYTDSHRKESPLKQAEDAIVIDNSNLSRKEQLDRVLSLAQKASA